MAERRPFTRRRPTAASVRRLPPARHKAQGPRVKAAVNNDAGGRRAP
jgi:hypothetical protein